MCLSVATRKLSVLEALRTRGTSKCCAATPIPNLTRVFLHRALADKHYVSRADIFGQGLGPQVRRKQVVTYGKSKLRHKGVIASRKAAGEQV